MARHRIHIPRGTIQHMLVYPHQVPGRLLWSIDDVNRWRDDWRKDFDNHYTLTCLTPGMPNCERLYVVEKKTSGVLQQSPTWYPHRRLRQIVRGQAKKAMLRAKRMRNQFLQRITAK